MGLQSIERCDLKQEANDLCSSDLQHCTWFRPSPAKLRSGVWKPWTLSELIEMPFKNTLKRLVIYGLDSQLLMSLLVHLPVYCQSLSTLNPKPHRQHLNGERFEPMSGKKKH